MAREARRGCGRTARKRSSVRAGRPADRACRADRDGRCRLARRSRRRAVDVPRSRCRGDVPAGGDPARVARLRPPPRLRLRAARGARRRRRRARDRAGARAGARISIDLSSWSTIRDAGARAFRARVEALAPDVVFANEDEDESSAGASPASRGSSSTARRAARSPATSVPRSRYRRWSTRRAPATRSRRAGSSAGPTSRSRRRRGASSGSVRCRRPRPRRSGSEGTSADADSPLIPAQLGRSRRRRRDDVGTSPARTRHRHVASLPLA